MNRNTLASPIASSGSKPAMKQDSLAAQNDVLTAAKDRAQLTATGAMSIVHVALLKEVLATGTEENKYYTVTLVLIISAITLQILAGGATLFITNLRSYYSKHKDFLLEDCLANCCCCRIVCHGDEREEEDNFPVTKHVVGEDGLLKEGAPETLIEESRAPLTNSSVTGASRERKTGSQPQTRCCPCYGSSRVLEDYEYDILEELGAWKEAVTDLELVNSEATVELEYIIPLITAIRKDMDDLEDNKEDASFEERYEELKKKLSNAQRRKEAYEEKQRQLQIANARGTILMEKADNIRRNRVLKMATFWQNIINYTFYTVFIINAFITGFGIGSSNS